MPSNSPLLTGEHFSEKTYLTRCLSLSILTMRILTPSSVQVPAELGRFLTSDLMHSYLTCTSTSFDYPSCKFGKQPFFHRVTRLCHGIPPVVSKLPPAHIINTLVTGVPIMQGGEMVSRNNMQTRYIITIPHLPHSYIIDHRTYHP